MLLGLGGRDEWSEQTERTQLGRTRASKGSAGPVPSRSSPVQEMRPGKPGLLYPKKPGEIPIVEAAQGPKSAARRGQLGMGGEHEALWDDRGAAC